MTSLKLKISKQSVEQSLKGSLSKSTKRRLSFDEELSDLTATSSSSDAESTPQKAKDAKARDTPTLTNKRPAKKRRVVSDEDYEEDQRSSPPPEAISIKTKRDAKGKVKASISATTTSITGKFIKNETQQVPRADEMNTHIAEQEKGGKTVPEVPTVPVDIPLKKKLPTIKKKPKPAGTVPPASVSTSPSAVASPSSKPSAVLASGVTKDSTPVTTLNPSGSGDFDLRDSNTWQSLLGKKTTNSGPRVGIEKRVSTQERRKQLDKMREEARALRNEQLKTTFDLQAQSQKILRFEKSLAQHGMQLQGPHILGAAFKDRLVS